MANEKKDEESSRSQEQVPASYAEKAMSSLLRLHDDLVEEKEKRIDLYRRLMDREQELAEVRSYVQLLESELARKGALPPGASGFLPAPGKEPEQRRLQPGPAGTEPERWAEPNPQPWSTQPSASHPAAEEARGPQQAHPAGEWQASRGAEQPSPGTKRTEASPPPQGSRPSQTSHQRGTQPPETTPSQRSSEQPAGRAPVVAWVPFNSGGRGGGDR